MAGTLEIVADLDEVRPHSPKWHELRRAGIGGSDAAAAVGISRWKTPYQLWAEKVSEAPPVEVPEDEEPDYITAGKILEAPVREWFSRRTGVNVIPFPKMVRNTAHPIMQVNVDGLTGPDISKVDGIYEGKTSRFDWESSGEVNIPTEAALQGLHSLAIFNLDVVHFACLVGGQKLVVAQLERNDQLIEDLIAIEEAFWQHVDGGTPPPVQAGDVATLRKQFEPITGKTIELSGTMFTTFKVRAEHRAAIKRRQEAIDTIDAEIMAFMGDAEIGTYQGETLVTWKTDQKGKLQGKELEKAYPEIAAQFRGTPGRRFLPKEIDQ
jgi:putative phage-type endonuclease